MERSVCERRKTSRDSDRQAGRCAEEKVLRCPARLKIFLAGNQIRNLSALFQSLGLPVTIAHAGLVPFLVSFLVGFFVQVSNTWP